MNHNGTAAEGGEGHLFYSVIIPTFRRPALLSSCLEALASQDSPRDRYQVIVVDDGDTPELDGIVSSLSGRMELDLIRQEHAGPAGARNRGAAAARGEILVFTDDDCRPPRGWLGVIDDHFSGGSGQVLAGGTINALPDNSYATASQLLINYLHQYYNRDPARSVFFTSNNMAIRAHIFREVGGFDTEFSRAGGEDRHLGALLADRGYRILISREMDLDHGHILNLPRFWRQHFNYGRGAYFFHLKRSLEGRDRLNPEPIRFYLELVRYPFTLKVRRPGLLSTLLCLSQAANAAGYFWEKSLNRFRR